MKPGGVLKNIMTVTLPAAAVLVIFLEIFFRFVIPACTKPVAFFDTQYAMLHADPTRRTTGLYTMGPLAQYRARRRAPTPRRHALDMRRTLRQNLRYGCEPLTLAWRGPKLKRRPLVVICDVSGSMEHYSRLLLKFVYVLGNCLDKVEAFVFSTRLTRITRQFQCGDVDASLDQVAASIQDWGGGTRLGEALKTFNCDWGRRLLSRGAVVLLVSDGLDRGDIDLLEREIQRLQLCCLRLIWLNPLLGSTDYRPLARGMRAALPYVDDFLPVHNLASLEHLGRVLERLGGHPGRTPSRA